MLRDVHKRILVEVIGGGHGDVVFQHRQQIWKVDVLIWNKFMNPIQKDKRLS